MEWGVSPAFSNISILDLSATHPIYTDINIYWRKHPICTYIDFYFNMDIVYWQKLFHMITWCKQRKVGTVYFVLLTILKLNKVRQYKLTSQPSGRPMQSVKWCWLSLFLDSDLRHSSLWVWRVNTSSWSPCLYPVLYHRDSRAAQIKKHLVNKEFVVRWHLRPQIWTKLRRNKSLTLNRKCTLLWTRKREADILPRGVF